MWPDGVALEEVTAAEEQKHRTRKVSSRFQFLESPSPPVSSPDEGQEELKGPIFARGLEKKNEGAGRWKERDTLVDGMRGDFPLWLWVSLME